MTKVLVVDDEEIIEKQNEALRKEHNELEQKVHERTEELMKAKISSLKDRLNLK